MHVASSLNAKKDTDFYFFIFLTGKLEDLKKICQLLDLPLASSVHPQKFTRDPATYILLGQLLFAALKL